MRGSGPAIEVVLFLAASLTISACVYRGAALGHAVLAPLDIPFTLFERFRDVAPEGFTAVTPENHYLIDQITYDLPLQRLAHEAIQSGRFPWWMPYSCGGRPLAADAHISLFDPARLILYRMLPFVLAYNWTKIAHGIAAGLGAFLLLRSFRRDEPGVNGLLALSYQFCGSHALYFGHPWIQGATLYAPWLWLGICLLMGGRERKGTLLVGASLAGYILAANLQAYLYLPLFLGSGVVCVWAVKGREAARPICLAAFAGAAAMCLSSIAWLHVTELFLISDREPAMAFSARGLLAGAGSVLGGGMPWALGTHETPDISKIIGQPGARSALGFNFFVGTAIWCIGAAAVWLRRRDWRSWGMHERWAALIMAGYALLLSLPSAGIIYARISPIACLALVVFVRHMIHAGDSDELIPTARKAALALTVAAAALMVGASLWGMAPESIQAPVVRKYLSMQGSPVEGGALHLLRSGQITEAHGALGLESPFMWAMLPFFALAVAARRWGSRKRRCAELGAGVWLVVILRVSFLAGHW